MATIDELVQDVLSELVELGVRLEGWPDDFGTTFRPSVMAVAYAPSPGVPAQLFVRPMSDRELALVVVNDAKRRYRAQADGADEDVFQSWDGRNERRVAIIYDLLAREREGD